MHRKKTGCKNEKAIDGYIDVLKKEAKEGTTAWVKNAKLKKYGIPMHKVQEVLTSRGLQALSSKLS